VQYVEHELTGNTTNFVLHLEHRGAHFKLPSHFVEILTLGAHTRADASADDVGTSISGIQVCDSETMDANTLSDDESEFDVVSYHSDTDDL